MKPISALICALAIAALAGCGADDGGDPQSPPPAGSLVVWERGGGIAGVAERLEIETDGAAVLTAGIDEREQSFELSDAELQRLGDELDAAELDEVEPPPENSICADCFSYEITAEQGTASWDSSVELPDSVTTLSAHLSEIASAHYPPGVDRIESMA